MKIFLTGASGLLGNALANAFLTQDWEVHVTTHQRAARIGGLQVHPLDLTDTASLRNLISTLQPEAIVNAAALSRTADCQSNRELSYKLNADLPWQLARLARNNHLRLIHYSTDMVFEGKAGNYHENSQTKPTNQYGVHKREAELRLRETCPEACVLRLPLLMGNSPSGNRSVHEAHWSSWKHNQVTPLFEDEWRTPVSVSNVARLTVELLERPEIQGLYHWCGADQLNRWVMGKRIAEKLGVPENLLQHTRAKSMARFKDRPLNLTMDCSKLADLVQTRPASFEEQLDDIVLPEA